MRDDLVNVLINIPIFEEFSYKIPKFIDKKDIKKGAIISEEGYISYSNFIYGKIIYSKDYKNNSEIMFHTGTSRQIGKIYKIPKSNFIKIKFKKKIHFITGDSFILRNNIGTVGGGKIIFPKCTARSNASLFSEKPGAKI
mgnify:CR=1 FL=1